MPVSGNPDAFDAVFEKLKLPVRSRSWILVRTKYGVTHGAILFSQGVAFRLLFDRLRLCSKNGPNLLCERQLQQRFVCFSALLLLFINRGIRHIKSAGRPK